MTLVFPLTSLPAYLGGEGWEVGVRVRVHRTPYKSCWGSAAVAVQPASSSAACKQQCSLQPVVVPLLCRYTTVQAPYRGGRGGHQQ